MGFWNRRHEASSPSPRKTGVAPFGIPHREIDGTSFLVGQDHGRPVCLDGESTLVAVGAPGSGKTSALMVPSLVSMNKTSLIVMEVEDVLFNATSGHRASLGPVFRFPWKEGADPLKAGLHPSFNPLSESVLPPDGPGRILALERLSAVLIPDDGGAGDRMGAFWTSRSRALLVDLLSFLLDAPDRAPHDKEWDRFLRMADSLGETSLPLAASFLSWARETLGASRSEGEDFPGRFARWLRSESFRAEERKERTPCFLRLRHSPSSGFGGWMDMPSAPRSALLSLVEDSLSPFLDPVVSQALSFCDLPPDWLRGAPSGDGSIRDRPVTLYLSCPGNRRGTRAVPLAFRLVADFLSEYLDANGRGSEDELGRRLGHLPVCFAIDDAELLPRTRVLSQGSGAGRLICTGGLDDLADSVSPALLRPLLFAAQADVVLGPRHEEGSLVLPPGELLCACAERPETPVRLRANPWFDDARLRAVVFDGERGTGPRPAPFLPDSLRSAAADRRDRILADRAVEEEAKEAESSPRRVIVVTPRDIQSLTRDNYGEMLEKNGMYACAEVFLQENECFVERPPEDSYLVTDRVDDVAAFVGKSRFVIFDEATLKSEVNARLREKGHPDLPEERAEFLSSRAEDVGETPGQDVYFLGFQDGAGLDLPEHSKDVTPGYAVNWTVEIFNFILGIEEQKRLFDL